MDEGRHRLAEAMKTRVEEELRIRWKEVARRVGITPQHLNYLRSGKGSITNLMARSIEAALEWPKGHIDQFLEPDAKSRARLIDPLTSSPQEIGEILEEYRKIHGPEALAELLQETLKVNMDAYQEGDTTTMTGVYHGEIPTTRPEE